jgi:hypothetical protein
VVASANAFLQFSKADVVSSVGLIGTFFLVQPLRNVFSGACSSAACGSQRL